MSTNSIWDWTEVVVSQTNTKAHLLAPPVAHLRSKMRSVSSLVALETDVNDVGHEAFAGILIDSLTSPNH